MFGSFTAGGSSDWFGGTSCAAPLWAGFTALVNQQAANIGHAPVGFINPAVYTIAASGQIHQLLSRHHHRQQHLERQSNLFYAVPGYDLCTGLGTPNGTNLINALAAAGKPLLIFPRRRRLMAPTWPP